jgi:hypothetical protein
MSIEELVPIVLRLFEAVLFRDHHSLIASQVSLGEATLAYLGVLPRYQAEIPSQLLSVLPKE